MAANENSKSEPTLYTREVLSRLRNVANLIRQDRDDYLSPERFDLIWRDGAYHGADMALMRLIELIDELDD